MNQKTLKAFLTSARLETFLFSLLILLLPTQLGKHFWPEWSYIYSLKIDYLAVTVYLWDILVYLLWGMLGTRWISRNRRIRRIRIYGVIAGVFLVSFVPSLVASGTWGVGISRLVNLLPAVLFGLYIASKSSEFIRGKILTFLPITMIYSGILAILQVLIGGTLGLWFLGERSFDLSTPAIATFNWYGQVFLRPYATFPHPNVLASFMLISGILMFFLARRINWYLVGVQVLGALTILLSFSRTSIAVHFTMLVFILRKQFFYLFLGLIFLLPLLAVRFESAFNFDNLSLIRREELAETAITLIQEQPWFGVGLNNYIPAAVSSTFLSGTNRFLQPVHNIFLLALVETGVMGLLGFVGLLVSPLVFWRDNNLLSRGQITGLLLIVSFMGMLDHYFLTLPQGQRILFLVWGLSWCRKSK